MKLFYLDQQKSENSKLEQISSRRANFCVQENTAGVAASQACDWSGLAGRGVIGRWGEGGGREQELVGAGGSWSGEQEGAGKVGSEWREGRGSANPGEGRQGTHAGQGRRCGQAVDSCMGETQR